MEDFSSYVIFPLNFLYSFCFIALYSPGCPQIRDLPASAP
jgi:hypothetical protein